MPHSFRNLDGEAYSPSPEHLVRWALRRRPARTDDEPPAVVPHSQTAIREPGPHYTWIGHATFVSRLGETCIATDPVWSERIFHAKRLVPPGVALDELPEIHAVTVSHNHYDHLDLYSLTQLHRRFEPLFIVPKGNGRLLTRAGIRRVEELDWWQSVDVDGVRVSLVPAHHWSRRSLLDTNRALWGGFVYEGPNVSAYHAGDTAFCRQTFSAIAERFPKLDWAFMPIGAYEPPWFLERQHLDPDQAGEAFSILGAKRFIAMHYGTFRLTDEPLADPPRRVRAWFERAGIESHRLSIPAIGETVRML